MADPRTLNVETVDLASGDASLSARVYGRGDRGLPVVMIPSLGRSARDFDGLGAALAREGYTAAALNPRGIAGSTGLVDGLTLGDVADDAAALARTLGAARIVAIGHGFGNGIARRLAVRRPELVAGVVALAAGGKIHDPDPDIYATMERIFAPDIEEPDRVDAIASGFFADGVVPPEWVDRWWPESYHAFLSADGLALDEDWWGAGQAQILVIQGLQDRIAPPENGHDVKALAGDRATVVDLDGAKHALLPEQPEAIERAVLEFLDTLAE